MTFKVLVTDYAWASLNVEREILADADAELVVARNGTEDELCDLAGDVDAILTCWAPVTERVLRSAPRCLTVARYGVGLDNIAVETATELGIVVSNVPDFCTDDVAEHAMALILAHTRNITRFDTQTRSGGWDLAEFGSMRRLRGQVLGLVGYGKIARAVAVRAAAFGVTVTAYSPSKVGSAPSDGVTFADTLDALLIGADIVSLHLPSTPETRKIIGDREIGLLRPSTLVVNTARGALIDEDALQRALTEGRIAGAALDVLTIEPAAPDSPFRKDPQVILSPHTAFVSSESVIDLQQTAARNVVTILRGDIPDTVVNPNVLGSSRFETNSTSVQ